MTPFGARRSCSLAWGKGQPCPAAPLMVRTREGKQEHVSQDPLLALTSQLPAAAIKKGGHR